MTAILNPMRRVPGRRARVVGGMFVPVKDEVPVLGLYRWIVPGPDIREKLTGKRCVKGPTQMPIPGLESRIALLIRMYETVEAVGGEAVAVPKLRTQKP